MNMKSKWLVILVIVVLQACGSDSKKENNVINSEDYNQYLSYHNSEEKTKALIEKERWSAQVQKDSNSLGGLGFLSGTYNQLFGMTGNVAYLDSVSMANDKALAISSEPFIAGSSGSRATSYISQHRFKEAKELLESIKNLNGKEATQHMLFDAYMEVGEYDQAKTILDSIKNQKNYSYLIRAAKWNDHKGDLDTAISLLEKAREEAESRKSKSLEIWTYSNIGDFYGHAGRIEDSYQSYLKTLAIDPGNAYVKKGLAWIAYSHDNNPKEALRILDSVAVGYNTPDYHLIRAEILEYEGNEEAKAKEKTAYWQEVSNSSYGGMYNAYNIVQLIEDKKDYDAALKLAEIEVGRRATPETYQLLAYANLTAGNKEQALSIIEDHVIGKTYEPKALFHAALIYKANGMTDKAQQLKKDELLGKGYEMGPLTYKRIKEI